MHRKDTRPYLQKKPPKEVDWSKVTLEPAKGFKKASCSFRLKSKEKYTAEQLETAFRNALKLFADGSNASETQSKLEQLFDITHQGKACVLTYTWQPIPFTNTNEGRAKTFKEVIDDIIQKATDQPLLKGLEDLVSIEDKSLIETMIKDKEFIESIQTLTPQEEITDRSADGAMSTYQKQKQEYEYEKQALETLINQNTPTYEQPGTTNYYTTTSLTPTIFNQTDRSSSKTIIDLTGKSQNPKKQRINL